jgi:polar amino acid transport system substrate-binding protein
MKKNVLSRLATYALLMLGVLAVANGPAIAQGTLEKIKSSGKFLAGVRFDYPPIGVLDAAGKPVGFGIDLATLFAEKLGVPVEFVPVTSKSRFALLQNGNIDAEFGPTTPSVKREEVADFSIPYVWDGVSLLVKKGASVNVKDYAPPKKIAVTQGSIILELIKAEVPNAEFVLFQEYPDAVTALNNGKVDAVGINTFTARSMVKKNANLQVGDDFFVDPWAITLRQNDSKWRTFVNTTMQELWKEGKFQALYEKHFNEQPRFKMWSEFRLQPGIGEK